VQEANVISPNKTPSASQHTSGSLSGGKLYSGYPLMNTSGSRHVSPIGASKFNVSIGFSILHKSVQSLSGPLLSGLSVSVSWNEKMREAHRYGQSCALQIFEINILESYLLEPW